MALEAALNLWLSKSKRNNRHRGRGDKACGSRGMATSELCPQQSRETGVPAARVTLQRGPHAELGRGGHEAPVSPVVERQRWRDYWLSWVFLWCKSCPPLRARTPLEIPTLRPCLGWGIAAAPCSGDEPETCMQGLVSRRGGGRGAQGPPPGTLPPPLPVLAASLLGWFPLCSLGHPNSVSHLASSLPSLTHEIRPVAFC